VATLTKAVQDGLAKKQPAIPADQLRPALAAFEKRQQAKMQEAKAKFDKMATDNQAKSTTFLAQNKTKPGVKTLPSGVQYRVIENGSGAKPTTNSTVDLEVQGPFGYNERPADGGKTQSLAGIKMADVEMKGMREALLQMPAGSKWEIVLPPNLAFGADPRTGFQPNVAVAFEVKLLTVK
jgi:peptidylprolyl isomerase